MVLGEGVLATSCRSDSVKETAAPAASVKGCAASKPRPIVPAPPSPLTVTVKVWPEPLTDWTAP